GRAFVVAVVHQRIVRLRAQRREASPLPPIFGTTWLLRGAIMSVRKRKWRTRAGEEKERWICDYVDQAGDRCIKTFQRKKDADAFHASVRVEVASGTHTPASKSITVAEAAEQWLTYLKVENRERSTVEAYRSLLTHHILPRIARIKLSALSTPFIERFRDE